MRYKNGALGSYSEFDMTRVGLVSMSRVDRRTTFLIYLPEGWTFHCVFWHQLSKDYRGIESFQLHQSAEGAIEISVIGDHFSPETSETIMRPISDLLGGVKFSIIHVSERPKTTQRRHLQVTGDFKAS